MIHLLLMMLVLQIELTIGGVSIPVVIKPDGTAEASGNITIPVTYLIKYKPVPPPPPPPPPSTVVATVTSPFMVTSNPYNQDTEYRVTSSLRQANAANPLPFDMPTRTVLANSAKKAYGHYFPLFSVSHDNQLEASDYYTLHWLKNTGEANKHLAYGGFIRDRPIYRAPRTGDWALLDATDECRWARDAGMDGFLVDGLSWNLADGIYQRGRRVFDAAKALNDPTFRVAYMVDTDAVSGTDFTTAADRIANAYQSGAYLMAAGKLLVSSFRPEGDAPLSFWQNIDLRLRTVHGLPGMAFVPCYASNWNAHPGYDSITYAMGVWTIGVNPGVNSAYWNNDAHSVNKLFMQPIAFGDSRPKPNVGSTTGIFDEQQGLLTLRDQWITAIANNVDWVQYRTWSDFSEGAQFIPSRNHGFCYLDVSAYYLSRWKTGVFPTIKRDAIYLSHRISNWDTKTTQVTQTVWQIPRLLVAHPGQNIVEVMTFMVAPSSITVKVGSNTYTYTAPAGVSNKSFPLSNGQVSVNAMR